MKSFLYLGQCAFIGLLLTACNWQDEKSSAESSESSKSEVQQAQNTLKKTHLEDEVSASNLNDAITTHVHLELMLDFTTKTLSGFAELSLQWKNPKAQQVILDTRDLQIEKVEQRVNDQWRNAEFNLGEVDLVKGTPLIISVDSTANKLRVYYASQPQASGLQWLSPEQTAGKKLPFMYSQSQAIHARSWIPIQDSPAMRVTYSAHIKSDPSIRVVMSADNGQNTETNGDYHFTMPQAIPPYLIAIGAGDLAYQSMSEQTGVYAEPSVLASAVAEFNDTQAMIEANEKLYGAYRWGQYDLLILPPAFPFGGMENPRLSFITPTVIAGDKSLVNLIAHELAHSWSGNLVTNATWRDLWLNEGFTSYVENRVMEEVFGEKRALMEQWLSVSDLKSEMEELPADDTRLKLPLNGRDPDDAFSGVPYVKGQLFLIFLEQKFGRDKFDAFIKQYFEHFSFQSITTETFLDYLDQNLLKKYPGIVDRDTINQWVFEPGLLDVAPNPQSDAFSIIQKATESWLASNSTLEQLMAGDWSVHEWLYFINELPRDLPLQEMAQLDSHFNLTQSKNAEIQFAWFHLSLANDYHPIMKPLQTYLQNIGRRKLIVPLYKQLVESSDEKKAWAKSIYDQARPGYHPLAQGTLDKLFLEATQ